MFWYAISKFDFEYMPFDKDHLTMKANAMISKFWKKKAANEFLCHRKLETISSYVLLPEMKNLGNKTVPLQIPRKGKSYERANVWSKQIYAFLSR